MHPKNIHKTGYQFELLQNAIPEITSHIVITKGGKQSINFHDPIAVKLLNRALLKAHYKINHWDIPEGYLCPPVPGRLDYLLGINDLLNETTKLTPKDIKGLDVGTGANMIYPLLGVSQFKWKFLASEIDERALENGVKLLKDNKIPISKIHLKKQNNPTKIFDNIIGERDRIAFTMCNPPFYKSKEEAESATTRKNKNLNQENLKDRNFGGLKNELWVKGGELQFIKNMMKESVNYKDQVVWFTTLVSQQAHVSELNKTIRKLKANIRIVDMNQGQKKSRFIAWSFLLK
ncbi:23S rRNA (adenine(1618)-N(6))-methyltransferase RlmF [Flammeovirga sp. MY04]|uniref:23S rRNA (adenine(1618)-N(6))-methyltransferase RlmF n=1 Tax=Flammeovirga sp. MY04 TaxID=1191459 RepID=UPI000806381D|nr:23S rRNA (adenine(1618)-N(6))-methyltransferase RlmF [Flammeovirga sp. MY04]ANQ52091.1 23S rRNA (adenine(1618)-N(6))-methyltransferase RlmF [Flammeovirga sp. MY04]